MNNNGIITGNAYDYVLWRGDLSFDQSPLNEVDIFLFSQISIPDFSGIIDRNESTVTLEKAMQNYFEMHTDDVRNLGVLQSDVVLPALKAMSKSMRYKNLRLSRYVKRIRRDKAEQFCGITVEDPGKFVCIAFQGTDDTIIGWKEDFTLAAKEAVAAHLDAVKYVNNAIGGSDAPKVYICGHSKGGNLALYSAVNCAPEIRDRITLALNFDGPGFRSEFFENDAYDEIKGRLVTIVSCNSTIGLILKRAGKLAIAKTGIAGPAAHDAFNWNVMGPKFVKTTRLSKPSERFDKLIDDVLENMDEKTRMAFIDELFDILLSTGAVTLTDLQDMPFNEKANLLIRVTQDKQVSAFIRNVVECMFR